MVGDSTCQTSSGDTRKNAPANAHLRQRALLGTPIVRPDTVDHRVRSHRRGIRCASELALATTDRFGGSAVTGAAYASIASHSLSFDHRLRVRAPLTAIASAFRCPTSTTR